MYKTLIKYAVMASIVFVFNANSEEKQKEKENHFNPNQFDNLISKTPTKPITLFGKSVLNASKKLSKDLLYKENDQRLVHLFPLYFDVKTFIEDEEVFDVLSNSSLREYWVEYNSTNNKFKRKRALKSFSSKFEQLKDENPQKVSRYVYKEQFVKSWYDFDFDSMSKSFSTDGLYKSDSYGCMLEAYNNKGKFTAYGSYRMPITSQSIVMGTDGREKVCEFKLSFGDDETSAEAVEEVIENVSIDADIRMLGKVHYDLLPARGVFLPTGELGLFETKKDKLVYKIESNKPKSFEELLSWTMGERHGGYPKKKHFSTKELAKIVDFDGSYGARYSDDLFKFRDNGSELLVWTKGQYTKYSTLARLVIHSQTKNYIRYKLSAISSGTLKNAPAYFDLVLSTDGNGFYIRKMDQRLNVSSEKVNKQYTNKIEEGHEDFLAKDAIRNPVKKLRLAAIAQTTNDNKESNLALSKPTTNQNENSEFGTGNTATVGNSVMDKNPEYAAKCDRDLQDLGSFFSGQHVISTQAINAPLDYVFPRLKKILIDEKFVLGEHNSADEFTFYEIVSAKRRYTTVATFKDNKLLLDLKMPAGTTVSKKAFTDYYCGIYEKI
jgi:hypothetical protein